MRCRGCLPCLGQNCASTILVVVPAFRRLGLHRRRLRALHWAGPAAPGLQKHDSDGSECACCWVERHHLGVFKRNRVTMLGSQSDPSNLVRPLHVLNTIWSYFAEYVEQSDIRSLHITRPFLFNVRESPAQHHFMSVGRADKS